MKIKTTQHTLIAQRTLPSGAVLQLLQNGFWHIPTAYMLRLIYKKRGQDDLRIIKNTEDAINEFNKYCE